jgi:two-component system chemotaxis response regulator CheY
VVEPEDGLVALERNFQEKPDVVYLDLEMRGMYGLEVLQKLRELDAGARIVVLSADIQTSSQELAEQGGAAAFINKPFDKSDILTALENALTGAR